MIEQALTLASDIGFEHAGKLNMSALIPMQQIRDMCSADLCKAYGHSWSCPPACGSIESSMEKFARYSDGILLQTTLLLEDDYDLEGMGRAEKLHKSRFDSIVRQLTQLGLKTNDTMLPLAAGSCTRCRKCTYPDRPCRYPDRLYSSMEAMGLWVSDVCTKSGMAYNYGRETITFTSCVLFR